MKITRAQKRSSMKKLNILFNAETKNLRIVIDQNFKTNAAKKHEQILNENKNLAKELGI